MNNIIAGQFKAMGTGVVSKSPMEKLAEEINNESIDEIMAPSDDIGPATTEIDRKDALSEVEDDDAMIERATDESVPAADVVIEKEVIGVESKNEPEGMVERRIEEGPEFVQLKQSERAGFDPNATINAIRANGENEGGVMANRMMTAQNAEGSQLVEGGSNKAEQESIGKYEVCGFSIQFTPRGVKGLVSQEVRDYYNTREAAYERFNGDKYFRPDGVVAIISRGAPVICTEDRQIDEYINFEWRLKKS